MKGKRVSHRDSPQAAASPVAAGDGSWQCGSGWL